MKGNLVQKALGVALGLGLLFGTVWVASKAWSAGSKKTDTFGK